MTYSTCCGAGTTMPEIGICPDCLEHCDWEHDDKDEMEQDRENENKLDELLINKNETKC